MKLLKSELLDSCLLRRTKKEWVGGMARMQDIGQYAQEQVQGLFLGSQWRMYNEMLREVEAYKLTNLHHESAELVQKRELELDVRRKELDVLEELNQLMIAGREEAEREREETRQRRVEGKAKTAAEMAADKAKAAAAGASASAAAMPPPAASPAKLAAAAAAAAAAKTAGTSMAGAKG